MYYIVNHLHQLLQLDQFFIVGLIREVRDHSVKVWKHPIRVRVRVRVLIQSQHL